MPDVWSEYDRWNDAIAEVIFARSEEVRPVYLDLEDDLLDELAATLDIASVNAVDALCDVAGATLNRSEGPARVFARHDTRLRAWIRGGRITAPPILGVLACFSLAAEQMASGDGMAANNYFGRLRQALRWRSSDPSLEMAYRRVAERYWSELNRWLVQEEGGRGIPTAYSLAHRYVGLSVSQALVRSSDRERLKEFFQLFGFAPGSQVAPADLVPLLDNWIKQAHCPVTASLARLWSNGQARSRIAEAAAVTLSSWDGSVTGRGTGQSSASGRLHLTLELGSFPRKRFAMSALLYVPQAQIGRTMRLLSAEPTASIDLVPDAPGALGLSPGSSLHPDDVLAGVLRVSDDYSGITLERRPRRLVAFREDEFSRRWVEVQQIMLGDDLRLLVEDGLAPRVAEILAVVARPGWESATPYPGQPEGWTLFTGVEVLNHPGPLIPANKMDDLAALIPLTASTLKISSGFVIPGSVRGKWHTARPPEVRAVSDAPDGFTVRLVLMDRSSEEVEERQVAEWSDHGTGVVIETLRGLKLHDADYRVELVLSGQSDPSSSAMLYLRSGDTRDERQWHLAESISYGPGIGALGVATQTESMSVQGHAVFGLADQSPGPGDAPPQLPSWSKEVGTRRREAEPMRITVPDSDSCIRTGRHREEIETVPLDSKGRPTTSWVHGRCKTCGLVKRYPTRGRTRRHGAEPAESQQVHPVHDLSALTPATTKSADDRDWTVAIDTLQHLGGGSWSSLEKVALQIEPTGLFVDHFSRTLETLGHISIRRDDRTLRPTAWEISPTQLTGCSNGEFAFNGHWPTGLYNEIVDAIHADGAGVKADGKEPPQSFASRLGSKTESIADECEIAVIPDAWRELVQTLLPMSEVLKQLPRQSASADGDISWFDVEHASWKLVDNYEAQGAYRIRKFATLDVVRSEEDLRQGTYARCPVQLSKHVAALMRGRPLVAYDPGRQLFMVPIGAELPGLYGRALTAASCLPPAVARSAGAVVYQNVPEDLASHVFGLLTR
ncbi:hypothetical protein [Aeromicrobium wangtongii]|uniref:Uncharacterized protein n=1 Tax=Aeromicrobium wangtongii TaxID=2969247 RepID=A0ABY5M2D5_9ACTN|nr:hypothetical protein [Aeromicrobium wangtongii]MCD9198336.1 hypothetical protein [Aeromicrobium wangtongii]UUP12368.1 hypothetical protein NQV15_10930 [Aeromicrobium wangtongii]